MAFGFVSALFVAPTGCGLAPKTFRSIQHPAPLVRARSIGLSQNMPDAKAVPALVERLDDTDPVVRLAAHEELKRRTGQDFGYIPWDDAGPRSTAVSRWKGWLSDRFGMGQNTKLARRKRNLASPQAVPTATRITLPSPPTLPSGQQ